MKKIAYQLLVVCFFIAWIFACDLSTEESNPQNTAVIKTDTELVYKGIFTSSKYDSVVNHLVLYPNETFDLSQVDRIAEHHLNEREHHGIYTFLSDSSQLGLYTADGVLMLRFLVLEDGLTPMTVGGDRVLDSTNLWKLEDSNMDQNHE